MYVYKKKITQGQVSFFPNILTSQQQDLTEQKFLWPVIMSGHRRKYIILSPEIWKRYSVDQFFNFVTFYHWRL